MDEGMNQDNTSNRQDGRTKCVNVNQQRTNNDDGRQNATARMETSTNTSMDRDVNEQRLNSIVDTRHEGQSTVAVGSVVADDDGRRTTVARKTVVTSDVRK